MKIRLDQAMYAKAQRIADAQRVPVSTWVFRAECQYGFTDKQPSQPLCKLTRLNSVSVSIRSHEDSKVTPQRIRACIALAIEEQDRQDAGWPWKYDRSTLEAAIQIEGILERRIIGFKEAEALVDRRVAQRKEELCVAEKAKRKK